MSPAHRWLAATAGPEPVLDVPVPIGGADGSEANALRQYSMLFVGRPRVDGCSGFVSRRYLAFRDTARAFPEDSALDAMRRMGAGILIVHYGDYAPEDSARVARRASAEPQIQEIARFGSDVAYRLLR
jgi:sugar phosphate isomerase/epimerase